MLPLVAIFATTAGGGLLQRPQTGKDRHATSRFLLTGSLRDCLQRRLQRRLGSESELSGHDVRTWQDARLHGTWCLQGRSILSAKCHIMVQLRLRVRRQF
jgi:hypothetical protein